MADREGVTIPRLCALPGLPPVGNCRACMVEIDGERVLAAACCRAPQPGMKVSSRSERARKAQQLVLELLQTDLPDTAFTRHNEVDRWADEIGVGLPRFAPRARQVADLSHAGIAVNMDACIQCTRCLRACREEQGNDVIGLAFSGARREDRLRHGRCARRLHLRGLRRMCAGLPDRGAGTGRAARRCSSPIAA